jgi:osmoprotectant transport system substrate-binding protein
MRRTITLAAALAATSLLLAACGDDDDGGDAADTTAAAETAAPATAAPDTTAAASDTTGAASDTTGAGATVDLSDVQLTVGSANFPENQLLAEMYAQALEAGGASVERNLNIGNRETYYAALESGEIQLLPEYTGSLLFFLTEGQAEAANVEEQITALGEALPENLVVLEPSPAEDKDTIVCNQETVDEYGLATLTDLFENSANITLGGPAEFEERTPFGLAGFEEQGASFAGFVPLEIGDPVKQAIASNAVNCGNLFSTDPFIAAEGLVALEDDLGLVPNEAVIPLIDAELGGNTGVADTLNAISAALDTDQLTELVGRVVNDAEAPEDVAADWLAENGLA